MSPPQEKNPASGEASPAGTIPPEASASSPRTAEGAPPPRASPEPIDISGPHKVAPVATKSHSGLPATLGRYTLVEFLGAGGMAEVFRATQKGIRGFEKQLVVKRMLPNLAREERWVEQFHREARLAALINHTNVVAIYDVEQAGDCHFMTMEYVEGATLMRLARKAWKLQMSLPTELVLCAIVDAARGLHHAHELTDANGAKLGFVHRDISPDNLIINRQGVTKILDFGVARTDDSSLTKTGEIKGKLPFMAPEVIEGAPIDRRVDIYALGCTLYWLLSGRRPLHAPNDAMLLNLILNAEPQPVTHYNSTVSRGLEQEIMRMIAKKPAGRHATAAEVAETLLPLVPSSREFAAEFVTKVLAEEEPKERTSLLNFLPARPMITPVPVRVVTLREADAVFNNEEPPRVVVAAADLEGAGAVEPLSLQHAEVETVVLTSTLEAPLPAKTAHRRRRIATIAATTVALLGAPFFVFKVTDRDSQPPPPSAPTSPVTPPTMLAPERVPTPAPAAAAPGPAAATAAASDSTAAVAAAAGPVALPPESARSVAAKAPPHVRWATIEGATLGKGNATLALPAAASAVLAIDDQLGIKTRVAIAGGTVDYAQVPRGKLSIRAFPFAQVSIGKQVFGTTPFEPLRLVAGTYEVRFVHKDVERRERVIVRAGATSELRVQMLR